MGKSEFYLGAAAVDNVTSQQDAEAIAGLLDLLGVLNFPTLAAAKAVEADAFKGKVRYIKVTVEVVEEPTATVSQETAYVTGRYPFDTEGRD